VTKSILKNIARENRSMNFWVEAAAELWHARIGRHLGDYDKMRSLGGAYPMLTAKGVVRKNRIGAGTAAAVLIDGHEAIVIGPLSLPDIPTLAASPVRVMQASPEYSLRKAILAWTLDERRVFPMLAVVPGKASSMSALRLSYSRRDIAVCSPGKTLVFDGEKVVAARDRLLAMGKEGRLWKAASEARQKVSDGSLVHLPLHAKNQILARFAQLRVQFPDDFWLPSQGTEEFEALGEALIDRPALPI